MKPAFRIAIATGLLLLVPLIAMQFTSEVNWSPGDFVVAGALLFGAGMAYVVAARHIRLAWKRAVLAVAVAGATAVIWAELAVGILR